MKRDLVRAFRHHGIRPLVIPVLVVASILLVVAQNIDGYLTHQEEATDLALRLEVMESTFQFSKIIEEKNELLKPEYSQIQARAFLSGNAEISVDSMQNHLTGLLQSLYFENIQLAKLGPAQNRNAAVLAVDAKFTGVPQQLPRLEAALAVNQKAMRVNRLQIKALKDASGGGPRIEINARFLGLHLVPVEPKIVKPVPASR